MPSRTAPSMPATARGRRSTKAPRAPRVTEATHARGAKRNNALKPANASPDPSSMKIASETRMTSANASTGVCAPRSTSAETPTTPRAAARTASTSEWKRPSKCSHKDSPGIAASRALTPKRSIVSALASPPGMCTIVRVCVFGSTITNETGELAPSRRSACV
eukprot:Amastigsp_a174546_23.p4 type:complete len:163 gc:universal Amastigsp_a174546_23:487-975(+)